MRLSYVHHNFSFRMLCFEIGKCSLTCKNGKTPLNLHFYFSTVNVSRKPLELFSVGNELLFSFL